jgi:sensor domain CHASE-containing protein
VLALLLYLGILLLALIAINVLLVRTIRAEKRRDREHERYRSHR